MKIIISLFLLFMGFSAIAQHQINGKFLPLVTRSIGGSFQQFDGLNSRVANLPQYKQLKGYTATLGLGWIKERNRLISAGGINIGSSMSGNNDKKSSTIRYFGLNADIGYDLLKSEKLMLYPLAGLGFQKYQAIFFKDNSGVAFNEVLQSSSVQNSIRSVKFNNSFTVYRLGVGFSVNSSKYPSSSIGMQAGFTGSFKNQAWRSNENQLLGNAPLDKINQF
ncbi:MAG: hypothetical protein ABI760_21415, partial [Ferruginibacter sp.]